MTPTEVRLVQEMFEAVMAQAEQTAALFYGRLFELDPSLRPMFKSDMQAQGRKLMGSLALIVRALDDPVMVQEAVRQLGQRHATYGVQFEDYETVGEALQWALGRSLGEYFTGDRAEAWTAAYNLMAAKMQEAAAEVAVVHGL